jgi:hypothetical protein
MLHAGAVYSAYIILVRYESEPFCTMSETGSLVVFCTSKPINQNHTLPGCGFLDRLGSFDAGCFRTPHECTFYRSDSRTSSMQFHRLGSFDANFFRTPPEPRYSTVRFTHFLCTEALSMLEILRHPLLQDILRIHILFVRFTLFPQCGGSGYFQLQRQAPRSTISQTVDSL